MYALPPISNVSTALALCSRSKPSERSVTEPAASRVPSSWMRASRMPLLWFGEAYDQSTATYMLPPISNTSAARAP